MEYRRVWCPGGCFFFTVVTYKRQPILTIPNNIARLRKAFAHVKRKRFFEIAGIVVLPNHLHCIWQLPEDDYDFATRWRLIKHFFSRSYIGVEEAQNQSRKSKNEKTVWQKRYWEHVIRGEKDWQRHMDYIHYNPLLNMVLWRGRLTGSIVHSREQLNKDCMTEIGVVVSRIRLRTWILNNVTMGSLRLTHPTVNTISY